MGDIKRWQGQAKGRNRIVEHGGIVYTVATAGAPGRNIREQTKLALAAIDENLADVGIDKTRIVSAQILWKTSAKNRRWMRCGAIALEMIGTIGRNVLVLALNWRLIRW